MKERSGYFFDILHIFTLTAFAVAQPLFDLLGRQAEFFVARQADSIDIVLLVAALIFLLPGVLCLVRILVQPLGFGLRRSVQLVLVAGLLVLIVLPAFNRLPGLSAHSQLGVAVLVALICTGLYARYTIVGRFVSMLSLAILVFPAMFLGGSGVNKLLFPEEQVGMGDVHIEKPVPIVMVVFDEFPLISLLDGQRQINPRRYPNFASLARDGYWFRNATTVAEHTYDAVPAILTGMYPTRQSRLPITGDHPRNLFTLLQSEYNFDNVNELMTALLPDQYILNWSARWKAAGERLYGLLLDCSIVYLHTVLPKDYAAVLPSINRGWSGFLRVGDGGKKHTFRRDRAPLASPHPLPPDHWLRTTRGVSPSYWLVNFLEQLYRSEEPKLHFMHIMLPHVPWRYLPSGHEYSASPDVIPGLDAEDRWENKPRELATSYRRHLLQVGFVDKIMGEILARLKEQGLYDDALFIVTSDHGTSFQVGEKRRLVSRKNAGEILSVPLFIKFPGQDKGVVSDRYVETVDILPTIMEVIQAQTSWQLDGQSLLQESTAARETKVLVKRRGRESMEFSSRDIAEFVSLQGKLALFGEEGGPYGWFRNGPYGDLVGKPVDHLDVLTGSGFHIQLDQIEAFQHVNPTSGFVPAHISGQLHGPAPTAGYWELLVVVNGVVAASGRTEAPVGVNADDNKLAAFTSTRFSVLMAEQDLVPGNNAIRLYVLDPETGRLLATEMQAMKTYQLYREEGREWIRTTGGRVWQLGKGALQGAVDHLSMNRNQGKLHISGWGVDQERRLVPERVLVFDGKRYLTQAPMNTLRKDVSDAYQSRDALQSGFVLELHTDQLSQDKESKLRILLIGDEAQAAEVRYPNNAAAIVIEPDDVYLDSKEPPLLYTVFEESGSYTLIENEGTIAFLEQPDGKRIPVQSHVLRGRVDEMTLDDTQLGIKGYAIDQARESLPDRIVLFVNEKFWRCGLVWQIRPGVARYFKHDAYLYAGFHYSFPRRGFEHLKPDSVHLFAVADDLSATELSYPKDFPWREEYH